MKIPQTSPQLLEIGHPEISTGIQLGRITLATEFFNDSDWKIKCEAPDDIPEGRDESSYQLTRRKDGYTETLLFWGDKLWIQQKFGQDCVKVGYSWHKDGQYLVRSVRYPDREVALTNGLETQSFQIGNQKYVTPRTLAANEIALRLHLEYPFLSEKHIMCANL